MNIRQHAFVFFMAVFAGSGTAIAQGMMGGGQAGYGPHMGSGMMGGQGGMGPGMMGQGGMMGSGMMPCPMMGGSGMGMQQLLEPEQRSEMREMMQEHRQVQLERMGQMMSLCDDLMVLMQEARPDPEEIQVLHGQMAELHGQMLADRVRHHNALNDLLTDEQREQLQQSMPYHRQSQ